MHLEFGNVLVQAKKKVRISEIQLMAGMDLLHQLSITTDNINPDKIISKIILLATQHHLTTYDAAYLELAIRSDLPLATKDNDLRKAVNKLGIHILPK